MKLAPLISIIGPEGAGKSTAVANLSKMLDGQKITHAVIFMGRGKGNIIPFNRWGGKHSASGLENSSQATFKKKIIYSIAACILVLDFQLRCLFHILPQRLQKEIVITDRYVTDLYNMRYVPLWLRKKAILLFPKPKLTFYLYNDIGVLHARKGRNLADLEWQLHNFSVLSKRFNAIQIKTGTEKETMVIIQEEMSRLHL